MFKKLTELHSFQTEFWLILRRWQRKKKKILAWILVTVLTMKKSLTWHGQFHSQMLRFSQPKQSRWRQRQLSLTCPEAQDVCLELERLWARAADCGERSWRKLSELSTAFVCACIAVTVMVFHMAFTLICFIFICFFSIFFCSRRWAASWKKETKEKQKYLSQKKK